MFIVAVGRLAAKLLSLRRLAIAPGMTFGFSSDIPAELFLFLTEGGLYGDFPSRLFIKVLCTTFVIPLFSSTRLTVFLLSMEE